MLNIVIELDEMHDINSLINIQSYYNFQNRKIW